MAKNVSKLKPNQPTNQPTNQHAEFQSRNYFHFLSYNFEKGMNSLISDPAIG